MGSSMVKITPRGLLVPTHPAQVEAAARVAAVAQVEVAAQVAAVAQVEDLPYRARPGLPRLRAQTPRCQHP